MSINQTKHVVFVLYQPFPRLFFANFGPIYCSLSNLFTCRLPTSLIACSMLTNLPLSLNLRSATFFLFLHTIFFLNVRNRFFFQKRITFSYRTLLKEWPLGMEAIIGGGSELSGSSRPMGLRSRGGSLKCYWLSLVLSVNFGVEGDGSRSFRFFLSEEEDWSPKGSLCLSLLNLSRGGSWFELCGDLSGAFFSEPPRSEDLSHSILRSLSFYRESAYWWLFGYLDDAELVSSWFSFISFWTWS